MAPSDARAVANGAVLRRCRGNWCCGGTQPAAGWQCMRLGQGAAWDGVDRAEAWRGGGLPESAEFSATVECGLNSISNHSNSVVPKFLKTSRKPPKT